MRCPIAVAVLAILISGCTGHVEPQRSPAPELRWGVMSVATTPTEAFEARGHVNVSWSEGRFGVRALGEEGMPSLAVKIGPNLYTTYNQRGWTESAFSAFLSTHPRAARYDLWDLQTLLASASVTSSTPDSFTAEHRSPSADAPDATITVNHEGETILRATLTTALDPESPFTFTPSSAAMGFDIAAPARYKTSDDVTRMDADVRDGHASIITWTRAYLAQVGRLPDEPSAQSLALQRLNDPWPANPYDSTPMRRANESGHFLWSRCSDRDATFQGLGWDANTIDESFGRGCGLP